MTSTGRVLAVGLLAAATLATIPTPARASSAPGLPRFTITGSYVTGISSGGFMATQLQVAYSGTFRGAGIFAAGPYGAGPNGFDVGALEATAATWAAQGRIDPLANLVGRPVYTYHGRLDPLVSTSVSDAGVRFYRDLGALTRYHDGDDAGHGWPTPLGILPCPATTYPFLINCGDDPEGELLAFWLGSVNPPNTGPSAGHLGRYDQDRYVPGGWGQFWSMAGTSLLYTSPGCAAGLPCRLVVALHGCASDTTFTGDEFPEYSYLDNYADTNNLVVLYPQASVSAVRLNPYGCWDWWGYDGPDYATRSGPEMRAILNMVHALGG